MIERIHLTGRDYQAHSEFWKNYLKDPDEAFHFRQKNTARIDVPMSIVNFTVPQAESDLVNKLAQNNESGIYVCMLAAAALVLKKYGRQHQLILQSPLLGATAQKGAWDIPLIIDVHGDITLRRLLNTITGTTRQCYTYQDYPWNEANMGRLLQRSNILIRFSSLHMQAAGDRYDLIIDVGPEGRTLQLQYNPEAYDSWFIDRFLQHLMNAISTMAGLDIPVQQIDILNTVEKHQLLHSFNQTHCDLPAGETVLTLFKRQAIENPHAIAVSYRDTRMTYQELDSWSAGLAQRFIVSHGVTPGDTIAVMSSATDHMILCLLGILKASACYLPVDPQLPAARKQYMLQEARVQLLLTDTTVEQDVYKGNILQVHGEISRLKTGQLTEQPLPFVTDAAYLIFTSGTTGLPKGVQVAHKGLVNMVTDQIRQFGIMRSDRVLQFASISFDASISEIFMALCAGAELVLTDRTTIKDEGSFLKLLQEYPISVLTLPPSYMSVLPWHELTSLRVIISAGEKINVEGALYLSRSLQVFNAYGPTEYTVCATINRIAPSMTAVEVESIGWPIANTQLYILNADGQPVPAGCIGELYIGGWGVALGYLNNPALTDEKFVNNPFSTGGRLYRTGDLASWLPDGRVLFHGRADNQVKIRGHRVELSEIEQVLMLHEAVKQCVLIITETTPANPRLIAFVPANAYAVRSSLIDHLQSRLPGYMIPAAWVGVDSFPLTVNGKIDNKQLLHLLEAGNREKSVTLPRNAMERQIAEAWKELLGLEAVGIHDDFFQLGGDSLLAIRLLSFLREQFSLNIPMNILFDITTIAGLAEYIYVATEVPEPRHDIESEELLL